MPHWGEALKRKVRHLHTEVNFLLRDPSKVVKSIAVTFDAGIDLGGRQHGEDCRHQGIPLFSNAKLAFNLVAGCGTSCFVCSPGSTKQSGIISNDWNIELYMTRNNKRVEELSRAAFCQRNRP